MVKLSDLAALRNENFQVVIALMNGIGDGVLAIPVIRYIVRMFGERNVILWAGSDYFDGVFLEFNSFMLPTIGAHRPIATNTHAELDAIKLRLKDNVRLLWVNLTSVYPPTSTESHLIFST